MQRVLGWLLASAIVSGLVGLWVIAQDYEPELTCSSQRAERDLESGTQVSVFDAVEPIVKADAALPSNEMFFVGAGFPQSKAAGACEVVNSFNAGSRPLSVLSFERYLDEVDSGESFRDSDDYEVGRDVDSPQAQFIDANRQYDREGVGFRTTHLLDCFVIRASWRNDDLTAETDSPEERDDLVRSAFGALADLC